MQLCTSSSTCPQQLQRAYSVVFESVYLCSPLMFLYSQNSEKYSIRMPNKWNFSFDYFYAAIVALGIYVPGMHLFRWHKLTTLGNYLAGFCLFSGGFICCRESSHVRVYAWTEEESSCKSQRGVDSNKVSMYFS